jgi:hypothetical protein
VKRIYSDAEPFTVETPSGLMGVRGTEFIVEHGQESGQSDMHTLDGKVAMAKTRDDLRKPGNFQMVEAGNRSFINRGMQRAQAPQPFDPQKLVNRLAQNHPRMKFDKIHQSMQRNPRYQGKFQPPSAKAVTPPRRVQHGPMSHALGTGPKHAAHPNRPHPQKPHPKEGKPHKKKRQRN